MPRASLLLLFVFAATNPGCSCANGTRPHHPDSGEDADFDAGAIVTDDTGAASTDDASNIGPSDSGYARSCAADSPDTEGCSCANGDAPRGCWPYDVDPAFRGVGLCVDGSQECMLSGEFGQWGPCNGAGLPATEYCANMLDDSCDGTVDCDDPTCASDPACQSGCTEGATRDCYTGNARTLDVGACHHGTQTCTGGAWSPDCPGEQLPGTEDCSAPGDLNCNRLSGCFDLFACATSPACQEHCADPLMPGCVCPMGSGDVATCPEHMHAVTTGSIGGTIQCCPCGTGTGNCGDPNCCNEASCRGNAGCGSLNCNPLPASCMGMVNADCDDFPEDCDEPCCECYGDCSGA